MIGSQGQDRKPAFVPTETWGSLDSPEVPQAVKKSGKSVGLGFQFSVMQIVASFLLCAMGVMGLCASWAVAMAE